MGLMATFERWGRRRFIKFGVPFMVLVIGGSFGLKEFTKLRYEIRNNAPVAPEDAERLNMKKSGEVTLESEYEKIKQIDIDDWENIRGPRPWEEENWTDGTRPAST